MKKVGRIPDGGGGRVHGKGSVQAKAVDRTKKRGARTRYVFLHSAIDGYSRLSRQGSVTFGEPRTDHLLLKSVAMSWKVIQKTPSCELMYSMNRSSINRT